MAFTADDVTMSLRRYLFAGLGSPWSLRLEREPVTDDARPVGVLESGRLFTPTHRVSLDQGPVTASMPVTVTCYPETAGSVRVAGRRARLLKQRLEDLMTYGLDLGSAPRVPGGPSRPLAGPDRVPLYDFAGVEVEGTTAERDLPEGAEPQGWVRVEDSGATSVQDPDDPRRWTVILELRLAWERPGRLPQETADAPLVASMPGTGSGTV